MTLSPPTSPEENPAAGIPPEIVPREIELKLAVLPEEAEKLWRHALLRQRAEGRGTTRQLRATYYDSQELDLRRRGIELRVRREGRRFIQAVKSKRQGGIGLVSREEDEIVLPNAMPRLEAIADPEIRSLALRLQAEGALHPVFETDIKRRCRRLATEKASLLACLDVGTIRAGERSADVCELELELIAGAPGDLFDVAAALQQDMALKISDAGKANIGYGLLTGAVPTSRRARKLELDPAAALTDAVGLIVQECLSQVLANEPVVRAGEDPEGIHQMRVGLRRLRSFFSILGPVLPAGQGEYFKAELKWLAGELGGARDLDVFSLELLAPVRGGFPGDAGLAALQREVETARKAAYAQAQAALAGRRYARLMLDFSRWLAEAAWTDQPLNAQSARLFAPVTGFADALLEKRQRKAIRQARRMLDGTAEERHEMRIQIKKLRYAAEFFRSLYPRKKAERYLKALSQLQDVLGHLNDVAVARQLVWHLLPMEKRSADAESYVAAGLVVGWHACAADIAMGTLKLRWTDLRDVERFWNKPSRAEHA
ncbi:CYTH and CHAD domain-containing protein [Oceanibaculum pacificum]|uniref:Adenylate cyclase n=1 Tax=Oceanibaculum pacificum TaxID=580166 RepID=A0A154W2H5_9PROT|nr:CYTH and CHAD domain-containing protein [Oceanibaculum pacificum]KZD07679.1 hypothetical protein AUP43_09895 [Oceanibaculum pacificum]